jgi:signal transduction histidine kinase
MEAERKLKILMLEDDQSDADLIAWTLRKADIAFNAERVDTREEFDEAIRRFKPDIVLSDHGLPQFNSKEALKICLKKQFNTPFILVTGTVSDNYAITCLREGADDYILKSNLSRLPSAILSAIKKHRLEKLKREARHALRKQNDELSKVNKELDNFVYSVSHNLRGPLMSVMGLLHISKSETSLESIRAIHTMMESSVKKLDHTLIEIIEFAQNARNEICMAPLDWPEIIADAYKQLEYLDPGNDIEKRILINNPEVIHFSDASRVRTILISLLSNAIQYRDPGKDAWIEIQVTIRPTDVTLLISDNGIGIPSAIMDKVFTMFYRGTEESTGAGLGLYITKETVHRLKGEIKINSKQKEGTRVSVSLPNGAE